MNDGKKGSSTTKSENDYKRQTVFVQQLHTMVRSVHKYIRTRLEELRATT
jgi:hypothetical protein